MGVYNVTAIPTAGAQVSSAYGSNPWTATVDNISAQVPVSQGTSYRVWQVLIAGAVPGESFNGIRLSGGSSDFLVGGGGLGVTRYATFHGGLEKSLAAFIDQLGSNSGVPLQGSGVGRSVDSIIYDNAFTSDDLIAGTFYVGLAGSTGGEQPELGDGQLRTSAFQWTIYTGVDQPNPPVGVPAGFLTNPVSNTNPGALPGAKLASLRVTITSTGGTSFAQCNWVLPAGLTWDANGTTNLTQNFAGGQVNSGLITVAPGTAPGVYQGSYNAVGFDNPSGSFGAFFQLTVANPNQGGWFFEI
jgi:hypothetical protein